MQRAYALAVAARRRHRVAHRMPSRKGRRREWRRMPRSDSVQTKSAWSPRGHMAKSASLAGANARQSLQGQVTTATAAAAKGRLCVQRGRTCTMHLDAAKSTAGGDIPPAQGAFPVLAADWRAGDRCKKCTPKAVLVCLLVLARSADKLFEQNNGPLAMSIPTIGTNHMSMGIHRHPNPLSNSTT
jgi:hypothetical protein